MKISSVGLGIDDMRVTPNAHLKKGKENIKLNKLTNKERKNYERRVCDALNQVLQSIQPVIGMESSSLVDGFGMLPSRPLPISVLAPYSCSADTLEGEYPYINNIQ